MGEPPTVTVEEAFDSRDSVTGENASVELRYIIRGTGWINSMALSGQIMVNGREQLGKQGDYQQKLKEQYEARIAKKYGLTGEQLNAISVEGSKKQWPMPNVGD